MKSQIETNNIKQKIGIYAFIAIATVFCVLQGVFVFAQSTDPAVEILNQQKEEKRRALLQIKERVNSLQKQINEQQKKIASLKNEIDLYDLQIDQAEQQIRALDAEIDMVNLEIIEILNQLGQTEKDIDTKLGLLKNLLQEIYENDNKSPLEIILSRDNFSDVLNDIQYTLSFQDKSQELLNELQTLKADLESKQQMLSDKKKNLVTLQAQTAATENTLRAQKTQRQSLLATTRGQETRYQAMLSEVSEDEAAINREIFDLDLQIREKLGDKSLPPVSGTLAWPMDGILTQGYGNTGFTKLGYTYHNGIDIAAPPNTPIYAAADGVVFATGTGKTAYGNWAVVKHTIQYDGSTKNIFTLYAHMSKISVVAGQGVLQGDLIGLEGNTGTTTALLYGPGRGYHIHFSIFDEEGFGIKDGAYPQIYGPYQIPYGYTYNPFNFLP